MFSDKNNKERPEAYPKPTETDTQLNNQPEYSEPEPNSSKQQASINTDISEADERNKSVEDKENS